MNVSSEVELIHENGPQATEIAFYGLLDATEGHESSFQVDWSPETPSVVVKVVVHDVLDLDEGSDVAMGRVSALTARLGRSGEGLRQVRAVSMEIRPEKCCGRCDC